MPGIDGIPDRHDDHTGADDHDSWQLADMQDAFNATAQPQNTSNNNTTQGSAIIDFVRCDPRRDVIGTTDNANSPALPSALGSQAGGVHQTTCATIGQHNDPACDLVYPPAAERHQDNIAPPRRPGIRGVATTTQENSVLTLSRADATVRMNELTATTTNGNNGKNTMPTLALSTGSHTAPHTKTSYTEVASQLNDNWFTMQNPSGPDPLICRPGFANFAMQTHVFCWSFVSIHADDICQTSLEDCVRRDSSHVVVAACSSERGDSSAID